MLISDDSITLFELSVVTNTKYHLSAANSRKEDRYGPLLFDLQRTGLSVQLVTVVSEHVHYTCNTRDYNCMYAREYLALL